ncbi:MAG: hypothetical protein QN173_10615 [Armatimonadota bacterium]|nr:hypothetical protein [Armatimonadota bacterium]MDR7437595.1 hypothetical protein [Armatimonadota bacterium]MDR7472189.1 hypothetical protein [Armatimonadota bacterium]MDR7508045.1 hypothetical protein [Armatimonadota bacterium]MDR7508697.1 hypothetical protein [Armatimonadota bacterium]
MDEQKPKSREEILAAIKAKADALRAQRAAAQPPPAAPAAPLETPISSVNVAGRPAGPPQNRRIRAVATVTQGVELTAERTEEENIKKLLGGLGAYANPLRGGVWQLDYRYYAEAKRRLQAAGYEIEEDQYGRVPLGAWTPHRGGWTKVED